MKMNHFVNFNYDALFHIMYVSGLNNEYFGSIVCDKQKRKKKMRLINNNMKHAKLLHRKNKK